MAHAEPGAAADLNIELVWSPEPGEVRRMDLRLPVGSTVADALRRSAWWPGGLPTQFTLAVWAKAAAPDRVLRDRDRIEVLRPLRVDPKEARRLRQGGQRAKGRR